MPEINNFNLLFIKMYNMVVHQNDKSICWSDFFLLFKVYKCYNFITLEEAFDYILLIRNELNKQDDEEEDNSIYNGNNKKSMNKDDINSILKKNNKYY